MSRIKAALTGALTALALAGCGLLPDPAGGGEYQVGRQCPPPGLITR